jgi:hypothetical protein
MNQPVATAASEPQRYLVVFGDIRRYATARS